MFWLEAHILRASSSTVWACISKRPAIDRISCGSVIKRVGISLSPLSRCHFSVKALCGKASPTSQPPAGVRVSTLTGAVLAAWVPTPRPLSEPMSAWVNGLLGRLDAVGGLTLVWGNTGAARDAISGAELAQPFGID